MNKPRLSAIIPISLALLLIFPLLALAQEEITITTYYPSPHGVYKILRLYPGLRPGSCDEGDIYYDDGSGTEERGLYVCDNIGGWHSVEAGVGGTGECPFWQASDSDPDNIHNINTGNVGIGTTDPSTKLHIHSTAYDGLIMTDSAAGGQIVARLEDGVVGAASRGMLRLYDNGIVDVQLLAGDSGTVSYIRDGNVGIGTTSPDYKLEVNGDIGADAYFYRSDISLKENISPLKNALERITQMNGVSFNWKESGEASIGLIAQDVEKIFPEAVSTRSNTKSIDYAKLIAPLIEAVKEQQAQIEQLKAEIEQLGIKN